MIDFEILEGCPVFKGIKHGEIRLLFKDIHYKIRAYKKGELIAIAGEPALHLFIVLQGSVKGEMIDYSGRSLKIEDIEAPRPLASAFLFGTDNRFPVTVSANNEVSILLIPVQEFLKIMQRNARVLTNFLNNISSRSQFLSQKLQFLNFKTIREKVAFFLLQHTTDRLHSMELKATQQQLSEMFGITRPSLARVLSEMQREKLFIIEKKTVTILNKQKLREILHYG